MHRTQLGQPGLCSWPTAAAPGKPCSRQLFLRGLLVRPRLQRPLLAYRWANWLPLSLLLLLPSWLLLLLLSFLLLLLLLLLLF